MPAKRDIYQEVTDSVLEYLSGSREPGNWQRPWTTRAASQLPMNVTTGQPYNGINVICLWVAAMKREYRAGLWATYKQWQEAGAQVRKGERGAHIVYVGATTKRDDDGEPVLDKDGNEQARTFLKSYTVFNADQVDGYDVPEPERPGEAERIAAAEAFIAASGARTRFGQDSAFYDPSADEIGMLDFDRFLGTDTASATENAYATYLHELTHWTGHKSRLDRAGGRFGSKPYAFEELIAELGAAFLCAALGITPQTREDHARYIAGWASILKEDNRAIFNAAAEAAKAADFLHSLQPGAPHQDRVPAGAAA